MVSDEQWTGHCGSETLLSQFSFDYQFCTFVDACRLDKDGEKAESQCRESTRKKESCAGRCNEWVSGDCAHIKNSCKKVV